MFFHRVARLCLSPPYRTVVCCCTPHTRTCRWRFCAPPPDEGPSPGYTENDLDYVDNNLLYDAVVLTDGDPLGLGNPDDEPGPLATQLMLPVGTKLLSRSRRRCSSLAFTSHVGGVDIQIQTAAGSVEELRSTQRMTWVETNFPRGSALPQHQRLKTTCSATPAQH